MLTNKIPKPFVYLITAILGVTGILMLMGIISFFTPASVSVG